jgi:23S rRNA (guanosine2251-2'-O)-methyltransferase
VGSRERENQALIYGLSPVVEALRSRRRSVNKIVIAQGAHSARLQELINLARSAGIPLQFVPREKLDHLAAATKHQGVVAYLAGFEYADGDEILGSIQPDSLLVLLDEVEDPRNLGAIIRTAHCAGARAVVIPKHRAVGLTETVAKTSAGAVAYTPVARVTNLVSFIRQLKDCGVRVVGVEADGNVPHTRGDYSGPVAFVFGSEGTGLRRLTKEHCDLIVSIPMRGQINSLNVSVAVGVVLFEVLRQRTANTA